MNVCVMYNLISYLRWNAVAGWQASVAREKNDLLYFSIALAFGEAVLGFSLLKMNEILSTPDRWIRRRKKKGEREREMTWKGRCREREEESATKE